MDTASKRFSLDVTATKRRCSTGEDYARRMLNEGKTPVFSCEGGCIRGEIARLAAGMVAKEEGYARACHAETFTVPGSAMVEWAKGAARVVMIDGCFLECHGRVLENIVDKDRLVHFDALSLYKRYTDIFDIDDVPEEERRAVAREVADRVIKSMEAEKTH